MRLLRILDVQQVHVDGNLNQWSWHIHPRHQHTHAVFVSQQFTACQQCNVHQTTANIHTARFCADDAHIDTLELY